MTVTVLSGPERRRRWTSAEKLQIVEESLAPGAVASEVARRHDIHRNQLYAWRREARLGLVAGGGGVQTQRSSCFVPVTVVPGSATSLSRKHEAELACSIEVVLRNGRVLRLPESVPAERAAALADALEAR